MPIGWEITVVALCVAVVALAMVVLGLLRQVTPVLERAANAAVGPGRALGPEVGAPLPHFVADGADGVVSDAQFRGRSAVLLFLAPGCAPCQVLAGEMRGRDLSYLADQVVIVTGPDGPQQLGIPADVRVLIEHDRQVSDPLSVDGTPFAIAVGPDGIVKAASVPNSIDQLHGIAAALS